MTAVERAAKAPVVREFIGRAWVNTVKTGELAGQNVLNLRFDRGVTGITVTPETHIELWPNAKRAGKRDADYRASVVVSAPVQSALV